MTSKENTAYCGIYCPDCIHYQNKYNELAHDLEKHLMEINFADYAKIESPFGQGFSPWNEFSKILNTLANTKCNIPCRSGGGCSGKPCEIMECCMKKGFEGCWDCSEIKECKKFVFLEPRCGEMPKKNIQEIKIHGIENWTSKRHNFYIWQK